MVHSCRILSRLTAKELKRQKAINERELKPLLKRELDERDEFIAREVEKASRGLKFSKLPMWSIEKQLRANGVGLYDRYLKQINEAIMLPVLSKPPRKQTVEQDDIKLTEQHKHDESSRPKLVPIWGSDLKPIKAEPDNEKEKAEYSLRCAKQHGFVEKTVSQPKRRRESWSDFDPGSSSLNTERGRRTILCTDKSHLQANCPKQDKAGRSPTRRESADESVPAPGAMAVVLAESPAEALHEALEKIASLEKSQASLQEDLRLSQEDLQLSQKKYANLREALTASEQLEQLYRKQFEDLRQRTTLYGKSESDGDD